LPQLLNAGVTCIQLRMKSATKKEIITTGKEILTLLRPKNIPLIINDHVEVTKLIDADGVHLGQKDNPYKTARAQLGEHKIIGLSIENRAQAQQFRTAEIDYFGVGPIYSTPSKSDAAPAIGAEELANIVKIVSKPVVAIGGINRDNVKEIIKTGVAGIAVISAIMAAASPVITAAELANIISKHKYTL
jgi:thiamine-phosphate pyrophosphorylase